MAVVQELDYYETHEPEDYTCGQEGCGEEAEATVDGVGYCLDHAALHIDDYRCEICGATAEAVVAGRARCALHNYVE
jgi:hypothetical protein